MQNSGGGGKVAIIGAIITAIAGIITAFVTISGPLLDKKMAISATQTREAVIVAATSVDGAAIQLTATPTPGVPAASFVEPSRTVLPPLTTAPTFTLVPVNAGGSSPSGSQGGNGQPIASATPTETMLRVGESWKASNGISVQLTKIEFPAGNEVHLHFTFTNTSVKTMNLSLDHNRDVTLVDDKGNIYTWATAFTWHITIFPGTSRNDEVKRRGDVSRASYFIVKLDIPGMGSAQWKQ